MKAKQWLAFALCGALAVGGVAWQLVPAMAESECTCEIQVHGSNCPLSRCTCDGIHTGEHTEGCALYNMNSAMTECVCQPDIHAEGCPRYEESGELLPSIAAEEEPVLPEEGDAEPVLPDVEEPVEPVLPDTEDPSDPEAPEPDEAPEPALPEEEAPGDTESPAPDAEETTEPDVETEPPVEDPEEEPLEPEVPEDLEETEEDWEYPSAWDGYGEGQMQGNVLVAAEAFTLRALLAEHVQEVQALLTNGHNARLSEDDDNFGDILAVYAVLSGQTEDYPYGIALADEGGVDLLRSVYWSMTQVTGLSNANGAAISVRRLAAAQGADLYNFTAEQRKTALALAGEADVVDAVVEESIFASLTEEEFADVLALLPEDVSGARRAVLLAAVSLDGKVDYFWGGKSLAYGWDDRWGELRTVVSEGSDTYGTARPLGLDCSGFISWAFLNVFGVDDAGSSIQWGDTEAVSWEDALPGDLVYYYKPNSGQTNHVGIVLTVDEDGPETVVHCAAAGGVQLSGADGFTYVRRPQMYGETAP